MANVNVKQKQPVETLNSKEAFFVKNQKAIIAAVVAAIVIIAGFILYRNYVTLPHEAEASTTLSKCQDLFSEQKYEEALNGDKKGCDGFLKVASDYSGTKAGNLANLYAGLCYANLDKWQEAAQYLDKFSAGDDTMISPAAMAALGNAYAHLKDFDKAVSTLQKAASMADSKSADGVNNSLSPTFLMQAADILRSQNKNSEALKIYQDIKTKYVNSPAAQEIDKYIEFLSE